jgi:hypothetical protein
VADTGQVSAEQQEREDDAAMRAGYERVHGGTPSADGDAAATQGEDQEQDQSGANKEAQGKTDQDAEEAAARAAAEAEWEGVPAKVRERLEAISGRVGGLDKIEQRLKSVEGRTGSALEGLHALKTATEAAQAATRAGGDAPTGAQIAEAATSSAKWKQAKEDYPDWAEAMEDLLQSYRPGNAAPIDPKAVRGEIVGEFRQLVATATSQARAEARELARLDRAHDDWEDVIKSDEFYDFAWTHPNAPSQALRERYVALKEESPDEAERFFEGLAKTNPQWWAERGSMMASDAARDAIKLLDAFKEHRKNTAVAPDATAPAVRSKKRLDAVVAPKQAASGGPTILPDEAGLSIGYNRVKKKYSG